MVAPPMMTQKRKQLLHMAQYPRKVSLTQKLEESFHHYVVKVAWAVIRWSQFATRKETSGEETKSLACQP